MKSAEILNDGKQIRVQVDWKADRPAPNDLAMFIHVYEPFKHYWAHGTRHGWYAGKEIPTVPTSQWKSEDGSQYVYHGESQTYDIPDGLPDGDYRILAGMCDPKTGGQFPGDTPFINHTFTGEHDYIRDPRRLPLLGYDDQENRVYIGSFRIHGGKAVGSISQITVSPFYRDLFARLAPNLTPMSYRGVETLGPVVVTKTDSGWELLPLPLMDKFTVTLDESVFGKIASVTCNGKEVQVTRTDNKVSFEVVAKDAMKYIVGVQTSTTQN